MNIHISTHQSRAREIRERLFPSKIVNRIAERKARERREKKREDTRKRRFRETKAETKARRQFEAAGIRIEGFEIVGSADGTMSSPIAIPIIVGTYRKPRISIDLIAYSVIASTGVTMEQIRSQSRRKGLVDLRRRIVMEIRRLRPDVSLSKIGRFLHRDHSTIINLLKKQED